ncbi:MAG TPA: FAD:protein FMN transferase [Cyclobacteriaceae bacterium]
MTNRAKNTIYSVFIFILVYGVYKYRQWDTHEPVKMEGATMGTTFHITYYDEANRNFKSSIDSLLVVFSQSLSTYIKGSEITEFNNGNAFHFKLPYFLPVLQKSVGIAQESDGAFDPTVMPLVNAWGFGPGKKMKLDSLQLDSIRQFVGIEKISFNSDSVWKDDPRVQLDFSAIAKGYGVDVVVYFLLNKGVDNLFVEIGGEVSTKGQHISSEKPWEVGILNPNSTYESQSYLAYAQLKNRAMATSGNYFNFYEEDGIKYSHTIDPASGQTIQHQLLSASVFAEDCMTADGWATAFMVMGHEKAIEKLKTLDGVEAFLIFSTDEGLQTYLTDGISESITIKAINK